MDGGDDANTQQRLPPFPNSSNSVIPFTKRHGIQRNTNNFCVAITKEQKKESIGGNRRLGARMGSEMEREVRRHAEISTITPPPRFAYFKEKTRKSEDKKFIHNSIENETGFFTARSNKMYDFWGCSTERYAFARNKRQKERKSKTQARAHDICKNANSQLMFRTASCARDDLANGSLIILSATHDKDVVCGSGFLALFFSPCTHSPCREYIGQLCSSVCREFPLRWCDSLSRPRRNSCRHRRRRYRDSRSRRMTCWP